MMAARETLSQGLDTLMVLDGSGASPWVHGFNHPVRQGDSAEVFLEDTLRSGQGLSDPRLARALCENSGVIFDELRRLGLSFNMTDAGEYQAIRPLGASYPRVISIGNETGVAVLEKLRALTAGKLRQLPHARAVRLLRQDGRVCGALVFDQRKKAWTPIFARAVVLCSGGFCGIFPITTNKRDSGGDGCAMAYEAGAELCDMEFIQFEPSASVWPPALNGTSMITTLFFEGAVLRNKEGERFMLRYGPEAERVGKDILARRIAAEIASGKGTEHGGVYMDITGVDPDRLDRDYPMYVKRYMDVGIDIKRQMIELAPAPHTSLGGVRIDEHGRTTLDGLFACGEVTGGIHGANRIGGSAGLETLVFGRLAGKAAADYASRQREASETAVDLPAGDGAPAADALAEARSRMRQTLWESAHVIRTEEGLTEGIGTLQALLSEAEATRGSGAEEGFLAMRLRNDLTTALMVLLAARERRETVGCHVRGDHPERERNEYRVVIRKDASGHMAAERAELEA